MTLHHLLPIIIVKTNHLWVNELSDNILSKIDNVRTSNDILDKIQKTFPDSTVKSVLI